MENFREPDAPLTGPFTRGQTLSCDIGFWWNLLCRLRAQDERLRGGSAMEHNVRGALVPRSVTRCRVEAQRPCHVAESSRERLFLQDQRGDQPDAEKANHLDQHVGGGVDPSGNLYQFQ